MELTQSVSIESANDLSAVVRTDLQSSQEVGNLGGFEDNAMVSFSLCLFLV